MIIGNKLLKGVPLQLISLVFDILNEITVMVLRRLESIDDQPVQEVDDHPTQQIDMLEADPEFEEWEDGGTTTNLYDRFFK